MDKKPNALIAFLESSSKKSSKPEENEPHETDYKPSVAEVSAARDILDAIKAGDPEALCKALYAHGEVQGLGSDADEGDEEDAA